MTVFEYFELSNSTTSIYKYAPVYTHTIEGQKVVIKKTKPQTERLESLFFMAESFEFKWHWFSPAYRI